MAMAIGICIYTHIYSYSSQLKIGELCLCMIDICQLTVAKPSFPFRTVLFSATYFFHIFVLSNK